MTDFFEDGINTYEQSIDESLIADFRTAMSEQVSDLVAPNRMSALAGYMRETVGSAINSITETAERIPTFLKAGTAAVIGFTVLGVGVADGSSKSKTVSRNPQTRVSLSPSDYTKRVQSYYDSGCTTSVVASVTHKGQTIKHAGSIKRSFVTKAGDSVPYMHTTFKKSKGAYTCGKGAIIVPNKGNPYLINGNSFTDANNINSAQAAKEVEYYVRPAK